MQVAVAGRIHLRPAPLAFPQSKNGNVWMEGIPVIDNPTLGFFSYHLVSFRRSHWWCPVALANPTRRKAQVLKGCSIRRLLASVNMQTLIMCQVLLVVALSFNQPILPFSPSETVEWLIAFDAWHIVGRRPSSLQERFHNSLILRRAAQGASPACLPGNHSELLTIR